MIQRPQPVAILWWSLWSFTSAWDFVKSLNFIPLGSWSMLFVLNSVPVESVATFHLVVLILFLIKENKMKGKNRRNCLSLLHARSQQIFVSLALLGKVLWTILASDFQDSASTFLVWGDQKALNQVHFVFQYFPIIFEDKTPDMWQRSLQNHCHQTMWKILREYQSVLYRFQIPTMHRNILCHKLELKIKHDNNIKRETEGSEWYGED